MILLFRLQRREGSFQTHFRFFRALLLTCKRFNKLLDTIDFWVEVGTHLISPYHTFVTEGIQKIMMPFYKHIRQEAKSIGDHSYFTPFVRDIYSRERRTLTAVDVQMVWEMRRLLISHYTQQDVRLKKQKMLKSYLEKYVPNDVKFI